MVWIADWLRTGSRLRTATPKNCLGSSRSSVPEDRNIPNDDLRHRHPVPQGSKAAVSYFDLAKQGRFSKRPIGTNYFPGIRIKDRIKLGVVD